MATKLKFGLLLPHFGEYASVERCIEGSKKAVKEFGVPEDLADGVAISLPIAEIVFALMLLPLTTAWFGAIGTFLLLVVFHREAWLRLRGYLLAVWLVIGLFISFSYAAVTNVPDYLP